jgi:hypothetical protein
MYKKKSDAGANVVEQFREVSIQCLGSFQSCDYRKDNKRGMNKEK